MKSPLRYIDELAIDHIFQPVSMWIYRLAWVNNYRLAKWFIFFASVLFFYQAYLFGSNGAYFGALGDLLTSFSMFVIGKKAA